MISARGARLSPSEAQPGQQAAEPTFTARPYAPLRACFASGRVHRTCGTGAGRATRPYSRTRRPCTTGCSLQPPRRVPRRGADASGSYGLGFALGAPGGMRALAPGRYPACITRAGLSAGVAPPRNFASLLALRLRRGRQSVAALSAAPRAVRRPLLRHAAGTRAATALGSRWSRGPKAPLDAGGGGRASRSSGGEPAKRDLLLEQRLVKCGQVRLCPTQCPLPCFACVTSTCFACH